MNFDKFKGDIGNLRNENLVGRAVILLMALIVVLLSIRLFSDNTVVTLVPPGLSEEASMISNRADAGIHKAWSLYLAESLGNVTPATSAFVKTTIEPLLGSAIRDDALILLERQIDLMRRDQTSFSFEPREVQYDEASAITYVVGRHFTHQAGQARPERVNRTYEFRWRFRNYMPVLAYIDTYEGAPRLKD